MAQQNFNGLEIPFPIKGLNPMYSPDGYAGPYNTIQDAKDTISPALRIPGRSFGVWEDPLTKRKVLKYKFEKDDSDAWVVVGEISINIEKTSDILVNDGEDGTSKYVQENELEALSIPLAGNSFETNPITGNLNSNKSMVFNAINQGTEPILSIYNKDSLGAYSGGYFAVRRRANGGLSVINSFVNSSGNTSTHYHLGSYALSKLSQQSIDDAGVQGDIAIGNQALRSLETGLGNVGIGVNAARNVEESIESTFIGQTAGYWIKKVNRATIIGNFCGDDVYNYDEEIIISNGKYTDIPTVGIGFRVKADGTTTAPRQTLRTYVDDETGKAVVTKEILENSITNIDNFIPKSEKAEPNGVATLDGGGKIPASQLPNSVMTLEGEWNADTNTPTLVNGTGNAGMIYEVTTAGTTDFGDGDIAFTVGDWVVYGADGKWYKSLNSNEVTSVNGKTGTVVLTQQDILPSENGKFLVGRATSGWEKRGLVGADMGLTGSTSEVPVWRGNAQVWEGGISVSVPPSSSSLAARASTGTLKANPATETDDLVPLGQLNTILENLEVPADQVSYDNTTSGLDAENAQDAFDEIVDKISVLEKVTNINLFLQYRESTVSGDDDTNLIQPDLGLPILEVDDIQEDSSYSGELVLNIENNDKETAKVIELFGAEIYNNINQSEDITAKITFTLNFFNQVSDNIDYKLSWEYLSSGEILFGEHTEAIDRTSNVDFELIVTGHSTDDFNLKKARLWRN